MHIYEMFLHSFQTQIQKVWTMFSVLMLRKTDTGKNDPFQGVCPGVWQVLPFFTRVSMLSCQVAKIRHLTCSKEAHRCQKCTYQALAVLCCVNTGNWLPSLLWASLDLIFKVSFHSSVQGYSPKQHPLWWDLKINYWTLKCAFTENSVWPWKIRWNLIEVLL